MREVEFKAKRKDNGKWVYGSLLANNDKYYICKSYEEESYGFYFIEITLETIGQYTGLKDKNGKKIYEGDIVKAFYFEKEVIGKIEFIYGTFALTNSDISDNQLFIFEKLEVIGNIYDNPELLEVEDE